MLYIVRFLHQTTTRYADYKKDMRCISFVSYIKPQLRLAICQPFSVVYRSFPTSNHNHDVLLGKDICVVYRSFPTSNHNGLQLIIQIKKLYIVRFLHQTTTNHYELHFAPGVVYRSFPTSNHNSKKSTVEPYQVVYRSFPTSNHNLHFHT